MICFYPVHGFIVWFIGSFCVISLPIFSLICGFSFIVCPFFTRFNLHVWCNIKPYLYHFFIHYWEQTFLPLAWDSCLQCSVNKINEYAHNETLGKNIKKNNTGTIKHVLAKIVFAKSTREKILKPYNFIVFSWLFQIKTGKLLMNWKISFRFLQNVKQAGHLCVKLILFKQAHFFSYI